MTRRLRPLAPDHLDALPCECTGCVFWETGDKLEKRCGAACDTRRLHEWYDDVLAQWGECGRVALEDHAVLGFVKYAPPEFLPQSRHFRAGLPAEDAVLLTCLHIRDDARQHGLGTLLLRAALRDLVLRGERHVQAFACASPRDLVTEPVVSVEFLLRNGFTVARPDPEYPLLRLDLRSLATITENIEAALQALRIPIRHPQGVPSPLIK